MYQYKEEIVALRCSLQFKKIKNIEDKEQLDEAVKLQIENNKYDKDWMGGKVEKIFIYEVEVPYIPIVEEIRPTRFNYLLEN